LALVKLLKSLGHEATAHDQWAKLDLTVDGVPCEAKVRKNGFAMFYEAVDAGAGEMFVKADRKPWIRMKISYLEKPDADA